MPRWLEHLLKETLHNGTPGIEFLFRVHETCWLGFGPFVRLKVGLLSRWVVAWPSEEASAQWKRIYTRLSPQKGRRWYLVDKVVPIPVLSRKETSRPKGGLLGHPVCVVIELLYLCHVFHLRARPWRAHSSPNPSPALPDPASRGKRSMKGCNDE